MAYSPAAGNVVNLNIGGFESYSPPSGSVADLPLRDPLVPVVYTTDTSWHVLAGSGLATSWTLYGGGVQNVSWMLLAGGERELSWEIQKSNVFGQDLAWHVVKREARGAAWHVFRAGNTDSAWNIAGGGTRALQWGVFALPRIVPGHYGFGSAVYGQSADRLRRITSSGWVDPPSKREEYRVSYGNTDELRHETGGRWAVPPNIKVEFVAEFSQASAHPRREMVPAWENLDHRRAETGVHTGKSPDRLRTEPFSPWTSPPRRRDVTRIPWGPFARLRIEREERYTDAARRSITDFTIPWDRTHRIRWEERWGKEIRQFMSWRRFGIEPGAVTPPAGNAADINLRCPLLDWPGYAVWLFLRRLPCPSPEAARRKAWFLMNSFSVVRLPDRAPVPVAGLSLSTDYDSWAWSLSMTLPDREALALISPASGTPWDVEVTINGHVWTAVIEGFADSRSFGKSGFTVTGRSRAAYLAAPYAQARNFVGEDTRTAAQLATEAVGESGWEVLWTPPDWLVPAGAYSYQGLTPIDALAGLAGAVGARLQTDRAAEVLRVISRYPVSPWAWDAADPEKTITDNLLTALSLTWQETPSFNGVYVSGQNQGVLVNVKKTGTDGTPNGQMIVDPLITHIDAGRERGRVFLAGQGRRATISLELPLLSAETEPGLLEPGQLVEVNDGIETWKGLVTATKVDVGRPTVRQTIDLERFYF